jgi:hypothetical protein
MGQVVIDCTATQMATALAAIDGRAAAMAADGSFDDPDLTVGQQRVAPSCTRSAATAPASRPSSSAPSTRPSTCTP